MIYLDNSATTRAFDEAAAAAEYYMREAFFNASSAYGAALQVDKQVITARALIAKSLGVSAEEIIFTSGGTESNNMAILGKLRVLQGKARFITSAVEHPSVYEVYRIMEQNGQDVVFLDVDKEGLVRMEELEAALTDDTAMVSLIHVNNEVGAVHDLDAIAALIRKKSPSAVFHADGVQAYLRVPRSANVDVYSLSGHKIHAPKGVGALMVKKGVTIGPGLIGGGQEDNMRSGTTNTPGIMGMEAALRKWTENGEAYTAHLRECKQRLQKNLLGAMGDCVVNGPLYGAPHILNVSFLGVRGEVLLHDLEAKGVYLSTGSACSARKVGNNRILHSMGITGERAAGAVRMSLSVMNTLEEMDTAAQHIAESVTALRKYKRK